MSENRVRHKWIIWGWDEHICEHCRINAYYPYETHTEYCDEYDDEKRRWKEHKERKRWDNEEHW